MCVTFGWPEACYAAGEGPLGECILAPGHITTYKSFGEPAAPRNALL